MKHGFKRHTTFQHAADRTADVEQQPLNLQGCYKAAVDWGRKHKNPLNPFGRKFRTTQPANPT